MLALQLQESVGGPYYAAETHTTADEVGPVEDALATNGGAVGLVFGAFGKVSTSINHIGTQNGGRHRHVADPPHDRDDALARVRQPAGPAREGNGVGHVKRNGFRSRAQHCIMNYVNCWGT
jgi:hypothetical protein